MMLFGYLLFGFACLGVASASFIDFNTSISLGKQVLNEKEFDYIIVGGGTTGLALARRLSDDPKSTVLVLEAGRSTVGDPLVTVPQHSFSFIGSDIDWLYLTAPQRYAANQSINLSSGKVLGGDSAVNGLVWTYPARTDWDDFEKMGAPGWNWNNLYAAVRKAENVNIPSPELHKEFGYSVVPSSHGHGGPVDTSFPPFYPLSFVQFINASLELGHKFNQDPYAGSNHGVYFSLSSQTARSVRETSEFAYFDPVFQRDNLIVCAHSFVTKLNISDEHGGDVRSSGVQTRFPDGSASFAKLKSTGELILSAGSVRTPQLLELSGIGDNKLLKSLGIEVKIDLPGVGEQYHDQPLTILTYKLKPGFQSFDDLGFNATLAAQQQELYDTKRQGWLTFAQGVLEFEPASTILTKEELETAKQLLSRKPSSISETAFELIKDKIFNGVPQIEYNLFNSFSGGPVKEPNTSYVSMAVTQLHPLSRGSIHINTTSIDEHPVIDTNVFESEWDLWFLAKATAYGRKFFETKAFKALFDPDEIFPGLQVQTQAQWEQFIKDTINLDYHSVGTAALGPRNKNGVVDPNLKVYGASNIRIADNSVMPLLVSAHTQTTAYAIGERAAELIKEVYK